MATIYEIAKAANVSAGTVSRILTGKTQAKWASVAERAEKIHEIAAEMGYRPNAAARAMRGQRTQHVGVLIRNDPSDRMTHLMTFETVLGINEGLEASGNILSIIRIGDIKQFLHSGSRAFREEVLDGMIVLCEMPRELDQSLQKLIPQCVWVESPTWRDHRSLRRDEINSGRLCAENLLALGYRDLVWVGHPAAPGEEATRIPYSGRDREAGIRQAIAGHDGVSLRRFDIAYDDPRTFSQMPDFLRSLRPQVGVIVGQAYQARWLAHQAASLGLRPPYDFGLVCCDDGYDITSMWPGLSRVGFDRFGLGVTAAQMMLDILQHPKRKCPSRIVSGRWIPGNTAWGPNNAKLRYGASATMQAQG